MSARDQTGTERTRTVNALTALVRSVALGLDARRALTSAQVTAIAGWRSRDEAPALATCRREASRLANRIRVLDRDLAANKHELQLFTAAEAPELLSLPESDPWWLGRSCSRGPTLAGCGPKPLSPHSPASAPSPHPLVTTVRYRLNRGGDRQLNRVLTTIVLVRMRRDPVTRAYVTRRAEGRTSKEIMRILKRYIARHVFRVLTAAHPVPTAAS